MIAIFGIIFLAMVTGICLYVLNDREEERAGAAGEQPKEPAEQLKEMKTVGKAMIVNQLKRIKVGGTVEEGTKLIKSDRSQASSILTVDTNRDTISGSGESPALSENSFAEIKSLKGSVIDEERANSKPTLSKAPTTPSISINKSSSAP